MSEWPTLAELKQLLSVTNDDWDGVSDYDQETHFSRVLAAAIEKVQDDVGGWDDVLDVPDARLAQAALRMAELIATRPDSDNDRDQTYLRLLKGHRRTFGVA